MPELRRRHFVVISGIVVVAALGVAAREVGRNVSAAKLARESCASMDGSIAGAFAGLDAPATDAMRRMVAAGRRQNADRCEQVDRALAWWRILPTTTTIAPSREYKAEMVEAESAAMAACRLRRRTQHLGEAILTKTLRDLVYDHPGGPNVIGGLPEAGRAVAADFLGEAGAAPPPSEEALVAEVEAECVHDLAPLRGRAVTRSQAPRAWADELARSADEVAIAIGPADTALNVFGGATEAGARVRVTEMSINDDDPWIVRATIANEASVPLSVDVLFPLPSKGSVPLGARVQGRAAAVTSLDWSSCASLHVECLNPYSYARARVRSLAAGATAAVEVSARRGDAK